MQTWYRLEFIDEKIPTTLPKIDQFRAGLLTAIEIGTTDDIIKSYIMYAKKISSENNKDLVKELLNSLSKPGMVKKVDRQVLFKKVFEIVALNRSFQRFVLQYEENFNKT
jgi:hypothetical protein